MGQYFLYANTTKKEYFHPHDIGGGAKAVEQFGSEGPNLLTYLLIKSDGSGGGDVRNGGEFLGRWAGDNVIVVGDYDSSGVYQDAREGYTNISKGVLSEYANEDH